MNIAEVIAIIMIILCALHGASCGLLYKVYSLIRFLLVIVLMILLTPVVVSFLPVDIFYRQGIGYLVAGVIASIILGIVGHYLKKANKIPVFGSVNKLGGALVGALYGVVFVWLCLELIAVFPGTQLCQQAAVYVAKSDLLLKLQHMNPLSLIS
ncbi:MAG: CvpA family protein [Eubacterium sp.]|nr:CvpA family protein [Eubacterium sp.]